MKHAGKPGMTRREVERRGTSERADALILFLQERRRSAQRELDSLFRRLRGEQRPNAGDEGDRVISWLDRELDSIRASQLSQTLRQIDGALAKHAQGRYARCVACDAAIPVARLRSLPFALYCRDCQEAAEESRTSRVSPVV